MENAEHRGPGYKEKTWVGLNVKRELESHVFHEIAGQWSFFKGRNRFAAKWSKEAESTAERRQEKGKQSMRWMKLSHQRCL